MEERSEWFIVQPLSEASTQFTMAADPISALDLACPDRAEFISIGWVRFDRPVTVEDARIDWINNRFLIVAWFALTGVHNMFNSWKAGNC